MLGYGLVGGKNLVFKSPELFRVLGYGLVGGKNLVFKSPELFRVLGFKKIRA